MSTPARDPCARLTAACLRLGPRPALADPILSGRPLVVGRPIARSANLSLSSPETIACSRVQSISLPDKVPPRAASAFSAFLRSTYVHKYMSADLPAFLLSCLPVPLPPCLPASLPPYLHALSFDVRFTSRKVTGLLLHMHSGICTVCPCLPTCMRSPSTYDCLPAAKSLAYYCTVHLHSGICTVWHTLEPPGQGFI